MVLIYDRLDSDPRVKLLEPKPFLVWLTGVGMCNALGRDTISVDELDEALDQRRKFGHEYDLAVDVGELVRAELVERLPHEHLRFLARMDLWAFDDDDVNW